ncbi:MAG: hypothetical protein COT81_05770 [Candidatus Buchananbacteria bacterium CG10_big_fil_rev_8_21_14_0_10_42_9]|uniref:LysM domain-containing protein n=1 Tax=Candidatus Buchananbacteria bacterium CG10_big_fil_rev_8_21_14_0_10_42_9 TaxID=1974526 RepID=A0A2H0VZR7_9BACT|nr:MAG: hypothetical protein COT81_05770 [Candidatus Buchananbacteria bacterium CG10_big_fil_rev_8_21_14_0_10_42_9]
MKIISVKIAAILFGLLAKFKIPFTRFGKKVKKIFAPLGWVFLFTFILPTYKVYRTVKKVALKFYSPKLKVRKNPILYIFSKRYIVHAVVIVISLGTALANINANEIQTDELATASILAQLVIKEDLGYLLEEGPLPSEPQITSYLSPNTLQSQPEPAQTEVAAIEGDLPLVTGGSTVLKPLISPSEAEIQKRDKIITYTIEEGENISYIARKFGVSVNTILWENDLTAYSIIRPGQTLTILPTSGITHKVASKDTVASIAKKYQADEDDIIEINKLASAEDIMAGETLIIPGGVKPTVKRTYTVRSFTAPTAPSAPVTTGTGHMQWPAGCRRISQYFGYRHSGLDIACSYGTNVFAADSGTVVTAQGGWNGGYGIYVVIDHGNGLQTLYGHNSRLLVSVGDQVTKGQVIAAIGSTGQSTGPHVHFEVRSSGRRLNPLSYIQ